MSCAVEWFVYGTGLSHWCCHVHEFKKWVFVQHSDIARNFICLTGNFRKGVVRLYWVAKCVAAWRRLKTTGLMPLILLNSLPLGSASVWRWPNAAVTGALFKCLLLSSRAGGRDPRTPNRRPLLKKGLQILLRTIVRAYTPLHQWEIQLFKPIALYLSW